MLERPVSTQLSKLYESYKRQMDAIKPMPVMPHIDIDRKTFAHDQLDKAKIKKLKKEVNSKLKSQFGTKRPNNKQFTNRTVKSF